MAGLRFAWNPSNLAKFVVSYYDTRVDIHKSARKHGVSDESISHAFDNALAQFDYGTDEHPPRYALVGLTLLGT